MNKANFQIPVRYLLLPLFFAIVIYVCYLFYYVGALKPVVISEKNSGPFVVLYKEHVGPYHKIVPVIEAVEKWAKENSLDCHLTFGLYLDNPGEIEEGRLRSRGGCLLSEAPQIPVPQDFQIQTIENRDYVTAVFEGSPGIGPMKVYPKVADYFSERRLQQESPVMEVYEVHSEQAMTTTYYFPIKKH